MIGWTGTNAPRLFFFPLSLSKSGEREREEGRRIRGKRRRGGKELCRSRADQEEKAKREKKFVVVVLGYTHTGRANTHMAKGERRKKD